MREEVSESSWSRQESSGNGSWSRQETNGDSEDVPEKKEDDGVRTVTLQNKKKTAERRRRPVPRPLAETEAGDETSKVAEPVTADDAVQPPPPAAASKAVSVRSSWSHRTKPERQADVKVDI